MREFVHLCFMSSAWVKAELNLSSAVALDWFLSFADSGHMERITEGKIDYYWVKYSKALDDLSFLNLSERQFRRIFCQLSGEGMKHPEYSPLISLCLSSPRGKRTYFAKRLSIVDALLGTGGNMTPLFEAQPIVHESMKRKRKLHSGVRELVEVLLAIPMPDKSGPMFQNKAPEDDWHYTKDIEAFGNKILSIFAGTFLREYAISSAFYAANPYTINPDTRNRLLACAKDWPRTRELILSCARNYRSWWQPIYEPENKDWLPRSLSQWVFNERAQSAVFLACINGKPPRMDEKATDRIWESLPQQIIDIAEVFKHSEWDSKSYWLRIASVIDWYKTYARKLERTDPNVGYWISGGQVPWFRRYTEWLMGLAGGRAGLSLGHIGTDNKTWAAWLTWAAREHRIQVELPMK